jgi:D-lactate dehydrogenase
MGFDLHGRTIGVIGTGKIGKTLIRILSGFGMRILAYDIYPDHSYSGEIGYEYVDLDTLCNDSDIITLNCPLTPETYHLINAERIKKMKPGVMLINTGRGPLIDTTALIDGLKSRKIGSAGLDVYEEESQYFFEDFSNEVIEDDELARLLTFNRVLITAHQGFFTEDALQNIAKTTLQNVEAYFANETLENEICYKCEEPTCKKEKVGRCF